MQAEAHRTLRIATRRSPLALWQAKYVADCIAAYAPDVVCELVPMQTSGDRFLHEARPGKGLFVKELETALLENEADLAVHSMKDMPAACPAGLSIVTILARDNPFDMLISHAYPSLEALPQGATVGTSSLRREAQLRACRPDLKVNTLRGNINTRLDKLAAGEYDAIILAAAGIQRLGLSMPTSVLLAPPLFIPACAQGALGIEARTDDKWLHQLLKPLHDDITALCVRAERKVSAELGGGCHTPLAVYAAVEDEVVSLTARVLSKDGLTVITETGMAIVSDVDQMTNRCVRRLIDQGARRLIEGGV